MPENPEEKVQVHKEREIGGMHRPMLMDGGEGKILRNGFVVKGIEHQREKKGKMTEKKRMKEFNHICQ